MFPAGIQAFTCNLTGPQRFPRYFVFGPTRHPAAMTKWHPRQVRHQNRDCSSIHICPNRRVPWVDVESSTGIPLECQGRYNGSFRGMYQVRCFIFSPRHPTGPLRIRRASTGFRLNPHRYTASGRGAFCEVYHGPPWDTTTVFRGFSWGFPVATWEKEQ